MQILINLQGDGKIIVKINRQIIKGNRADRGWSQQHLADACDVSLRTIQRTENLGAASMETVMALAASFEIDVADLTKGAEPQQLSTAENFLPKTQIGMLFVILCTAFMGSILGACIAVLLLR